jgi:hypothetical protein
MQTFLDQMTSRIGELLGPQMLRIIGALSVLLLGWIVALIVALIVKGALRRTTLDNRLAKWAMGEETSERIDVERWTARAAYYVVLTFAVVGFFATLNLTAISEPLMQFLNRIFEFAPNLIAGGLLALVGWIVATVMRRIVSGALRLGRVDERLGGEAGLEQEARPLVSKTLGDAAYWLALLLFLPAILESLALQGLLAPVQGLVDKILGFLPNVLGAAVILAVGWFVARVVQRVMGNLLKAAGTDRLGDRVGLGLGARGLSGLLGFLVYLVILVPVVISALGALQIDAVTQPASAMLGKVMAAIPSILAASLLLVLAYAAARLIASLVSGLLEGVGFNKLMATLGVVKEGGDKGWTPALIVGNVAMVGVMLFAAIEAASLLAFDVLATLLTDFLVFAGRVLLGLVLFGVGLYLSGVAARAIKGAKPQHAGLLSIAARVSILAFASAIALRHMGLANEIIQLAFGLMLGAVAVAVGLAFGLGGREAAAQQLKSWQDSVSRR